MRIPLSRVVVAFAVTGAGIALTGAPSGAVAPSNPPSWTVQLGTTGADSITGISTTASGDVYVGGETTESLAGSNLAPSVRDAFVAKYDKNGIRKWIRQFGTAADDAVTDVAVTSRGDLYVVGITDGTLSDTNPGGRDGFLAKYDKNGNRKWIRRIGSAGYDEVRSVAVTSSGDAYVTGYTSGTLNEAQQGDNDSFVAKYDRNGKRKWLRQFGSSAEERGSSIAVTPNGTSYAVGYTYGNPTGDTSLGDLEGYVVSFDKNGKRRWIHLISTSGIDEAMAVSATAAGDVYVVGSTTGTLNETPVGMKDAFIARFTSAGVRTWVHQFGAALNDFVEDIATTSNGDAFVVGITTGSLNETNLAEGSFDPFITRYTRAGDRAWFRQFGTAEEDLGLSVAVTPAGDAYVGGYTGGTIGSAPSSGGVDGFVTKFGTRTTRTWLHTLATSTYDSARGIASTSSGDIYVTGQTFGVLAAGGSTSSDIFLAKYDKYGNRKWIRQFGSSASDDSRAVAVDARGDVYIVGNTSGTLVTGGGTSGDIFLAKYDRNGNRKWIRQFGSTEFDDGAMGVAVDGRGNVYLTGYAQGSLNETNPNPGTDDAFIAKYDKNGNRKWVHQLGTTGGDYANSVAVTSAGDAYIGGYTDGALAPSDGTGQDAFIAKYDRNGNRKWVRQFGTAGSETVNGLAIGRSGSVIVVGATDGVLVPGSPTLGSALDGFAMKYDRNGIRKWANQFGSGTNDELLAVATATNGDIFVAGYTQGTTPGETSSGMADAAYARLDSNGVTLGGLQFGSSENDVAYAVTWNPKGGLVMAGYTRGRLNEPAGGSLDAFITRLPY